MTSGLTEVGNTGNSYCVAGPPAGRVLRRRWWNASGWVVGML